MCQKNCFNKYPSSVKIVVIKQLPTICPALQLLCMLIIEASASRTYIAKGEATPVPVPTTG